ncbi:hypothetical protein [Puerhibacterium sp. TATVAM-FAB25]|uniref:hypothetical protein n=1 Tax=Puerhibacterium sp. TATVAM-FAB25 TaxID=3093699 RepID=UPI00397B5A8D
MTTAPLEPRGDDRGEEIPRPDGSADLPATPEDPTEHPGEDPSDGDPGRSPAGMPEETPFRTPEVPD